MRVYDLPDPVLPKIPIWLANSFVLSSLYSVAGLLNNFPKRIDDLSDRSLVSVLLKSAKTSSFSAIYAILPISGVAEDPNLNFPSWISPIVSAERIRIFLSMSR